MKLYHFSDGKYSVLKPMMGKNRHSGEDKRIVGKPVVWLTADNNMANDEATYKYKYTVEINEKDKNLILDEALYNSSIQNSDLLGDFQGIRWYAYLKEIHKFKIKEWNNIMKEYRELLT